MKHGFVSHNFDECVRSHSSAIGLSADTASADKLNRRRVTGVGSALAKAACAMVICAVMTVPVAFAQPLFTEYLVPTAASVPCNTIPGPDHAVWFEELAGNKIGRLDPATGAISEYPVPSTLPTYPAPEIVATLTEALGICAAEA